MTGNYYVLTGAKTTDDTQILVPFFEILNESEYAWYSLIKDTLGSYIAENCVGDSYFDEFDFLDFKVTPITPEQCKFLTSIKIQGYSVTEDLSDSLQRTFDDNGIDIDVLTAPLNKLKEALISYRNLLKANEADLNEIT